MRTTNVKRLTSREATILRAAERKLVLTVESCTLRKGGQWFQFRLLSDGSYDIQFNRGDGPIKQIIDRDLRGCARLHLKLMRDGFRYSEMRTEVL